MFKKIEIWIVLIILIIQLIFTILLAAYVRRAHLSYRGENQLDRPSKIAKFISEIPNNIKKISRDIISQDIGSAASYRLKNRFPNKKSFNGKPIDFEAYLLLSRYDGNEKRGVVELIDLRNFTVLHIWKSENFLNTSNSALNANVSLNYLNHPLLTKNGSVITNTGYFLQKHNLNGEIEWLSPMDYNNINRRYHHSINKGSNNTIWACSRLFPFTADSRLGNTIEDFRDDAITKIDLNTGLPIYDQSLSNIFKKHEMEYLILGVGDEYFNHDPFHLNDIHQVFENGKYWKEGDVFLSIRNQSMVLLYRPNEDKIIWKGTGPFFRQHDVNILDEKRISIFNNNSKLFNNNLGSTVDGNSEIIIYDFEKNQYSSYMKNSLKKYDVRTKGQGLHEIIDNGDLYIEETQYGRILYFDADGSLKWTYINKADNNEIYAIFWSRLLYSYEDVDLVHKSFQNK